MNKSIVAILIGVVIIGGAFLITQERPEEEIDPVENDQEVVIENGFIECLKEEGVVIYGTRTCPACQAFADSFGGYDVIEPIYVDCNEERDKCMEEAKTGYVPEIQIRGELYQDSRDPQVIGEEVGCQI